MNRHNSRAGRKVGAYMKVSLIFTSCSVVEYSCKQYVIEAVFSEVSNFVGP